MKPRNFPARKLVRKLKAEQPDMPENEYNSRIQQARTIRTKKSRSGTGRLR